MGEVLAQMAEENRQRERDWTVIIGTLLLIYWVTGPHVPRRRG